MPESNDSFGPNEYDYYPIGDGSYWYTKWIAAPPARRGFKFHVSPQPEDAEIVARSVLPRIRELRIFHKVVRDLARYLEQWNSEQAGKFITIYTCNAAQGQLVLDAIDPELHALRTVGGIGRGHPPTTRESNHREYELPIGRSGLIFTRYFDENSQD